MKNLSVLFLFLFIVFSSAPSISAESDWQGTKNGEGSVRLIIGGYIAPDKILAGLEMKFADDWHTYWRVPGDSGMPVTPDFTASENVKNAELLWPYPKRHIFFDLEGWVYSGKVIMPVIIDVTDASKPVKINVTVKWAVCNEDCLFAENNLSVDVPENFKDAEVLAAIETYKAKVPTHSESVKLQSLTVKDDQIIAEYTGDKPFAKDADIFISEPSKNFRFPKPLVKISDDGKGISFTTKYEKLKKGETLTDKKLNLVLTSNDAGYETNHKAEVAASVVAQTTAEPAVEAMDVARETAPPESALPKVTLIQALLAALLGGLILNVMPCVLPVLFLKIFGVIKHSSADKKYIRQSFAYTAAGIISSFVLLAIFVLVLKSIGAQVGWGTQFQNPVFLLILSTLLTLFAANQWGWFEIILPHKFSNKLHGHIDSAGSSSKLGNFLTGAFATLLATPCTAPFLVTAVSFAFTANALTLLLVFVFMGIGLALPYILVCISPSLVKFLPRPGKWMKYLRVVLGIVLYITNIWICLIFFQNAGPNAGYMMFVCTVLILIWLGVAHKFKLDKFRSFITVIYMVAVTFGVTLYLSNIEREPVYMHGKWEQFDEAKIAKYVEQGRIVYVDVTADWCLTCQLNKAHVLYPMKKYLDENKVVLMKADYTTPSKPISAYLEKNGVFGIPFNKVYGPRSKDGIVLPVLLNEMAVKDAIERARELGK